MNFINISGSAYAEAPNGPRTAPELKSKEHTSTRSPNRLFKLEELKLEARLVLMLMLVLMPLL
ncbi:MAG: hypothetical protein ACP5P2_00975 [Candidatus Micrarchaeia archaeon]|jgi:hypothetical protein